MTMTGAFLGTLRYVSPEQAMTGRVRVDHRTDIYSLGATMYELLCFQPAFPGTDEKEVLGAILAREPTPPRKIHHAVPPELETICLKCLEKLPDARYANARGLADDLRRYINDLPIVAKPPGPITRVGKFVRRRKAPVIAVTAVVLLLFTGTFLVRARTANRKAQIRAKAESAVSFVLTNRWQEAEDELQLALQLDSNDTATLVAFAWMKLEYFKASPKKAGLESLEEVVEVCGRILRTEPRNVTVLGYQGVALRRLQRYPEAIETLENALALEPGEYASWSNLGALYAATGDLKSAEERLKKGAEIAGEEQDEWHAHVWRNLAAIELHLQRPVARDHIRKAIRCHKQDMLSWVIRARLELDLPEFVNVEEALDNAKHADKLADEKDAKAKRVRATAHLRNAQFEHAVKHAVKALELKDMPTINHLIIAVAEANRGNVTSAREHLGAAKAAWPEALLKPNGFSVAVGTGDLWIDSADELYRLRAEAEKLLEAAAPQPAPSTGPSG